MCLFKLSDKGSSVPLLLLGYLLKYIFFYLVQWSGFNWLHFKLDSRGVQHFLSFFIGLCNTIMTVSSSGGDPALIPLLSFAKSLSPLPLPLPFSLLFHLTLGPQHQFSVLPPQFRFPVIWQWAYATVSLPVCHQRRIKSKCFSAGSWACGGGRKGRGAC